MARVPNIRITKNDRSMYNKLARNSKRKIARTKDKYDVDLSSQVNIPKSIDDFKTRNEFNKWKKEQQQFTDRKNTKYQFRKNKYGVVASVEEINKIKLDSKKAQKLAKEKIKEATKLPFISGGIIQGKMKDRIKQMSKEEVAGVTIPKDFDFDKVSTPKRLEHKMESMEKRSTPDYYTKKDKMAKDNFIDMIEKGYNSYSDNLVEKLKKIPVSDFIELYIMVDEIGFQHYDSDQDSILNSLDKLESLEEQIEAYFDGKIDMSLKKF